ncbi:OLC1v1014115C1 [Oldenlandia corymbosa var. corymbosa]|uniref:Exonuclease 1 n=1 Tax=Oldenlandia corymbosa var. corymbosa TaxID=529605 RepID=A0AAV1E3H9_OLDCO|nr:OLC1v1014115C1 [Oldenlandia corymbosa var. corymbosa]
MGIKDLLRFMKPYIEPIHIEKYAGQRVGIDAYSWLHKGAYSCSMELSLNTEGQKKFQYLNYFMHRIYLLRHYKVTPVVVFDGGSMPCKAATQDERERRRKENRDLAMEKLKEGNVSAATELFQRAVSITPFMAHQLIQILRSEDVEFLVAPYEADAQLAYLSSLETEKGGIQAVISEDSDLLAYGCPSVIFKMDRFGNGEEIILEKAFSSTDRVPSFRNFDKELFTGMCVLAGCDFLPSIPGIGIARAHGLVSKYRNLDRVLSILKLEKKSKIPESYSKCFKESVAVFKHARVYDGSLKLLKHMNPIPDELLECFNEGLDFLGPEMPPSMVTGIAHGDLHPGTLEAFNESPDSGHVNLTNKFRADRLERKEKPTLSSQEGCFAKQISSLAEVTHVNGALELEKLMLPLDNEPEKEYGTIQKEDLKLPDNNPFRKRKREEIQLEETESTVEQVSVLTEVETSEVIRATPDSQQSVESKPINLTNKHIQARNVKKVKQNNSLCTVQKNGSILNFFSRV